MATSERATTRPEEVPFGRGGDGGPPPEEGWPVIAAPLLSSALPATHTAGGVTLYTDRVTEDYYLDVQMEHDPLGLEGMLLMTESMGLEIAEECDPEVLPNGTIRHFLALVDGGPE